MNTVMMRNAFGMGSGGGFPLMMGGMGDNAPNVDGMSYDELLELEALIGDVKPKNRPASLQEVSALPTFKYKKRNNEMPSVGGAASGSSSGGSGGGGSGGGGSGKGEATESKPSRSVVESGPPECAICLSAIEEGDEVRTLPCMHLFHKDEIDHWLLQNESCPVCKFKLSAASDTGAHESGQQTSSSSGPR
jgi:hypothetical protein